MTVTRLVDTNVLVYLFDPRSRAKQTIARGLLRDAVPSDSLVLAHQTIVEFVAAVTQPRPELGGAPLLSRPDAHREAEDLIFHFPVIYPDDAVLRTAIAGAATYQISWYDAHMWAYAEVHGLDEILSEDYQHGRHYGSVRVYNPFLVAADEVHELPPLYEDDPEAGRTLGDRIRDFTSKTEIGFT